MLMLIVPLALTNTLEGAVSHADGRALLNRPVFGSDNYPSDMEAWINDRIGLGDEIIKAYDVSNNKLFGELMSSTYQYGKEGHIFFKVHSNIDYDDYHKVFAEMISDMQHYCESRGTKFYYVFNPEKERVYARYLPKGANYSDEWADRMLDYMEKMGVDCIDLRDTLTDRSYDEDVFNRQYDAGHWNHNGEFYGMKILTEHIHKDIPDVKILEKDEFNISTTVAEKIYGSNQVFNEEVPKYTLKAKHSDITEGFSTELAMTEPYTFFQLIKNDSKEAGGIKRLLFFEDDLYTPFAQARSRETAIVSCMQNAVSFDYYYNIFKPDVVVFENMEYVVNDSCFSQGAMDEADYNPAILKLFPEEDFTGRRDNLIESSQQFDTNAKAVVLAGDAVDKIMVSEKDKSKYSYLITSRTVIDLKDGEDGLLYADIRHNDLSYDKEVVLYTIDKNGKPGYAVIPVSYVPKSVVDQAITH